VAEREHVLKAVRGDPPFTEHQASVVDEHVDALQPTTLSQSAHLFQGGEVGDLRDPHNLTDASRSLPRPAPRRRSHRLELLLSWERPALITACERILRA
jgi:hypothetical protein